MKYLFRTFGFKDREAWLRKINALPCVRVPSSHEQEKIHKQETRTSMLGGLFRRSSFALTDNSQHSAAVKSPLIDADTLDKREVRYFLKECGFAKHYNDFVGKGVTSFQKLVDFVADSGVGGFAHILSFVTLHIFTLIVSLITDSHFIIVRPIPNISRQHHSVSQAEISRTYDELSLTYKVDLQ